MNQTLLVSELTRDEGCRYWVYDDATGFLVRPGSVAVGHPTIGIGRALDVRGISPDEAQMMLANDIASFTLGLQQKYAWFNCLDDVRQRVLVNMAFNLGLAGIEEFRAMLEHLAKREYSLAASEMENSEWFKETGDRAARLVKAMATGIMPL